MSQERAEALCREEARTADGVSGRIGVGGGSGGATASGSITLTSDIFSPRDEREAFADCMARRMAGDPAPARVGLTLGGST